MKELTARKKAELELTAALTLDATLAAEANGPCAGLT